MVPDIEFRLYESTKPKLCEKKGFQEKEYLENTIQKDDIVETDLDEQSNDCDILGRLSRIIQRNGYVCSPLNEQNVSNQMIPINQLYVIFYFIPNLNFLINFILLFRQRTFLPCLLKSYCIFYVGLFHQI